MANNFDSKPLTGKCDFLFNDDKTKNNIKKIRSLNRSLIFEIILILLKIWFHINFFHLYYYISYFYSSIFIIKYFIKYSISTVYRYSILYMKFNSLYYLQCFIKIYMLLLLKIIICYIEILKYHIDDISFVFLINILISYKS